ncbi:MAG TPA: hypothetical protein VKV19_18625 [Ktedonobacteraceae bacterium]|nr:hypothetical protein [Ktedonobacteraceae bacterium]
MSDQEQQIRKRETIIDMRKLTALGIVLHGSKCIFAEFAGAVILGVGLGVLMLSTYRTHPASPGFMGLVPLWIALNYVPLLLYAIDVTRRGSAWQEVAFELEQKEFYVRKYTFQSAWVLLPLAVPILALVQEMQKRLHRSR